MYQPGLHILTSISVSDALCLRDYTPFKVFLSDAILQFDLKNLGEVYHNFSPEGFSAVVCLSESHISVHTWPEHHLVNYDIYLSNFLQVNDGTVKALDELLQSYFKGHVLQSQAIKR